MFVAGPGPVFVGVSKGMDYQDGVVISESDVKASNS